MFWAKSIIGYELQNNTAQNNLHHYSFPDDVQLVVQHESGDRPVFQMYNLSCVHLPNLYNFVYEKKRPLDLSPETIQFCR